MIRRLLAICTFVLVMSGLAVASNDPYFGQQYGLAKIKSEQSWASSVGDGITVAIVDTGIDRNHIDLSGKVLTGFDFVNPGTEPHDETTTNGQCSEPGRYNPGHGTHVGGIVGALTGNGIGVASAAPGAKLLPVRVLDKCGTGYTNTINQGIKWAVDSGARVINLSLGPDVVFRAIGGSGIDEGIQYAWNKGAVVVLAAGNDATLSFYSSSDALVVSATNEKDEKPAWSTLAADAKYPIAAPGEDILSTLPKNSLGSLSGTSMAAPHVSAVAAQLLCLGMTNRQVVERIIASGDNVLGLATVKRLNALRAVMNQGACLSRTSVGGGGGTSPGGSSGSGGSGSGKKTVIRSTPSPGQSATGTSETPTSSPDSPDNPVSGTVSAADGPGPSDNGSSVANVAASSAILLAGVGIFLASRIRKSSKRLD